MLKELICPSGDERSRNQTYFVLFRPLRPDPLASDSSAPSEEDEAPEKDQDQDQDGEGSWTDLRFIELDDEGRELASREMRLPGDVIYVDAWTARFPSETVASASDPFRDQTIVLLRRIYSDQIPPRDGIPIDTPGGIPDGYAGSDQARFEQAIWSQFWTLASDPEAARKLGIRVAQGEAVYKPMEPGETYELRVEAAGGMTLVPINDVVIAGVGNSERSLP